MSRTMERYFDCKVCGRHMTRMIDPDGRPWIQVDRTLPEGGLDFHTSGVYCPNCIPRSMEAGWKRAMSLRASRVANAELMGGEGVPCTGLVRHCMKCGQIKQHSSPSACVCKSCVLEQECDLGVQRIIRDIESPNTMVHPTDSPQHTAP